MKKIKAGLLPLYIKLYDDAYPNMRLVIDKFHADVSQKLRDSGLDVVDVPVCRIEPEFVAAIKKFEDEDCDVMITLNLAYSPSLESAKAIAETYLPVVVMDTTTDYVFDQYTDPDRVDYNHGIHGVQDLCNLMRRNGKGYVICAGHLEESDVAERVCKACKSALIAKTMKTAKIGLAGGQFPGMGDFEIPFDQLKKDIGMEVINYTPDCVTEITDKEIEEEFNADMASYVNDGVTLDNYKESAQVALSLRKWIEREGILGFSMNFMEAGIEGFECMPFIEASKAMAAGIGYAGEGDVLTAALVGSLMKVYPSTSFVEMFCPNWRDGTIFLNHMGEFNPRCSDTPVTIEYRRFNYGHIKGGHTVALRGRHMPGKAIFLCLAPQKDNKYAIIASKVKMLDIEGENKMDCMINGWFKPAMSTADFLEEYSRNGGIHHAAMIWGGKMSVIRDFATLMGFDFVEIK